MTDITRRGFLKLTGVATGGLLLPAGTAQAAGDIPIPTYTSRSVRLLPSALIAPSAAAC
ncbi:MAG: twin-arginine translocation signal domain-containing protein [Anaerolineae bacterium]|nr:twin-arginine translocation signal domain-containing protein [Anaerolineae bacterium]